MILSYLVQNVDAVVVGPLRSFKLRLCWIYFQPIQGVWVEGKLKAKIYAKSLLMLAISSVCLAGEALKVIFVKVVGR